VAAHTFLQLTNGPRQSRLTERQQGLPSSSRDQRPNYGSLEDMQYGLAAWRLSVDRRVEVAASRML